MQRRLLWKGERVFKYRCARKWMLDVVIFWAFEGQDLLSPGLTDPEKWPHLSQDSIAYSSGGDSQKWPHLSEPHFPHLQGKNLNSNDMEWIPVLLGGHDWLAICNSVLKSGAHCRARSGLGQVLRAHVCLQKDSIKEHLNERRKDRQSRS